jgi:thioesterase domain-containing protein
MNLPNPPTSADQASLAALEQFLTEEIPLSAHMGVRIERLDERGLTVSMPLEPNRNIHQTAFAGSLNALCTLAGWAMTHLLIEQLDLKGATVIRRSSIKYHTPVQDEQVVALCLPTPEADFAHFAEMLVEKGQAKLDHVVQIDGDDSERPAVLFAGSFVVHLANDTP